MDSFTWTDMTVMLVEMILAAIFGFCVGHVSGLYGSLIQRRSGKTRVVVTSIRQLRRKV